MNILVLYIAHIDADIALWMDSGSAVIQAAHVVANH